jgi:hypothetical protein
MPTSALEHWEFAIRRCSEESVAGKQRIKVLKYRLKSRSTLLSKLYKKAHVED